MAQFSTNLHLFLLSFCIRGVLALSDVIWLYLPPASVFALFGIAIIYVISQIYCSSCCKKSQRDLESYVDATEEDCEHGTINETLSLNIPLKVGESVEPGFTPPPSYQYLFPNK